MSIFRRKGVIERLERERAESGRLGSIQEERADSTETFEERLGAVSLEQRMLADGQPSSTSSEWVVDSPEVYDSPRIYRSPEERTLYNQVIERVVADVAKDPQEYWDRIDRAIDTINHRGEVTHE